MSFFLYFFNFPVSGDVAAFGGSVSVLLKKGFFNSKDTYGLNLQIFFGCNDCHIQSRTVFFIRDAARVKQVLKKKLVN